MKNSPTNKKSNLSTMLSLLMYFSAIFALFALSEFALAGGGGGGGGGANDIGTISGNIAQKMTGVVQLITAGAYVGGVAFALMGMLKFKAHKDNPTQVPLSQPITLLAIAAGLVFLPFIIQSGGATIWGTTSTTNTATGTNAVTD